jgi:type III secretory pathway component EscV
MPLLPTAGNLLDTLKGFELFSDLVLAVFLVMGSFVAHKMILEKMQMKAEKGKVSAGAIKGGGDSDSDEDSGEDAPEAVPVTQEKPKVAKAAAASMRRRHA